MSTDLRRYSFTVYPMKDRDLVCRNFHVCLKRGTILCSMGYVWFLLIDQGFFISGFGMTV